MEDIKMCKDRVISSVTLTKAEEEFFFNMGKRDFACGVPCIPCRSGELMQIWESNPCKIGSDESKRQTIMAKVWTDGWTAANLAAPVFSD